MVVPQDHARGHPARQRQEVAPQGEEVIATGAADLEAGERHEPVGHQRDLEEKEIIAVGENVLGNRLPVELHQRLHGDTVEKPLVGALVENAVVEIIAKILEKKKTPRDVPGQDGRGGKTDSDEVAGDTHKGPDILDIRRRIHEHGPAPRPLEALVAAEGGIPGNRPAPRIVPAAALQELADFVLAHGAHGESPTGLFPPAAFG